MTTIRKILAPIDGSEYTAKVIGVACDFARLFNADLTIFHVVAMPISADMSGMPVAATQMEEAGNRIVERAKSLAEPCGVKAKFDLEFSSGNPGLRIVKKAEAEGVDLIVIGAKGKNRLREILMGSVANSVVNNARCLVLVVRSDEAS
jgi:nucleotide-binding universal stress UspA family protein